MFSIVADGLRPSGIKIPKYPVFNRENQEIPTQTLASG
jgi:hypothetical protein